MTYDGMLFPNFGMSGPGASGELVIALGPSDLVPPIRGGSPFGGPGNPGLVNVPIPDDAALVGQDSHAQAMLIDLIGGTGVAYGLTNGLRSMIQGN